MTGILAIGAEQVASTMLTIGWYTAVIIGCAWLAFLAFVLLIVTVDAIRKPVEPDQWLDDLPDLGQPEPEPGSWRDLAITEALERLFKEGDSRD